MTVEHEDALVMSLRNEVETLRRQLSSCSQEHVQQVEAERRARVAAEWAAHDSARLADYYVELYASQSVPATSQQTHWPCGSFEFPESPNVWRFNPSLVEYQKEVWLCVRRLTLNPDSTQTNEIEFWRAPEQGAVEGNPDRLRIKLKDFIGCPLPKLAPDDNFEDPRCFIHRGHVWVSTCQFRPRQGCYAHQCLTRLDAQFQPRQHIEPVLGNNRYLYQDQAGHEKNWSWFDHEGELYVVYRLAPEHTVVYAPGGAPLNAHKTARVSSLWQHGEPRGGNSPVRMRNEYFGFFHGATAWSRTQRRYHAGCYAFEAKPPFAVTRATILPLLTGSENDPRRHGMPLVVFPGGALFKNGEWFVTFGINDCACGWIRIPHEELLLKMAPA